MNLPDFLVPTAHAITSIPIPDQCDFKYGDIHFDCIPFYVQSLTYAVISLAGSISLIMLMYNGFRWMIGPVTEGSTDAAKKGILYSILGLIVSLMAYAIIDTVVSTVTQ
ncbi:MAG: hypothetical protein KBD00_04115 [Candidatus Peribacteraceae bacterium]|nr:hypothetical protein [Candidatus Peribacteraceae bacterium]